MGITNTGYRRTAISRHRKSRRRYCISINPRKCSSCTIGIGPGVGLCTGTNRISSNYRSCWGNRGSTGIGDCGRCRYDLRITNTRYGRTAICRQCKCGRRYGVRIYPWKCTAGTIGIRPGISLGTGANWISTNHRTRRRDRGTT